MDTVLTPYGSHWNPLTPRDQPSDDGMGTPRDRSGADRLWRPTWSRLLVIQMRIGNNANKRSTSQQLHQPFRIDAFHVTVDNATTDASLYVLGVVQSDFVRAAAGDILDPALWSTTADDADRNTATPIADGGLADIGQIITNVPCRLQLSYLNASGATMGVTAYITITHLDRVARACACPTGAAQAA